MSSPDDAKPQEDEPVEPESPKSEHAEAAETSQEVTRPSAETPDGADDDLPEWEPLTPEFVEEEAIRGDFMLRWAAILVAMLMAWTVVDRTEVLVHVKTGQYLTSHGLFPPRVDVFSATATDRAWVNLSWLWDVVVGGVESTIGPSGLSILAALMTFATFWIVSKTSVPEVSTWWGSVCALLAAAACFPSLTANPHLVTLLGVACTMSLLYRWQWDPTKSLWPLVGLFLLWGNLDGRAWIGGVILILFAIGTWIDGFRTLPEEEPRLSTKLIGIVTVCSLVALLVHPFLWETWMSPLRLYGVEYPILRSYATSDLPYAFERYSVAFPQFWENLNLYNAASLLLMMVAGVTLLLNRDRLRVSQLLVLIGVNAIGMAGGRELAVASIVNAIAATINGQQWYRATFRQTYSIEPSEILFSRGGRALTVIAIFGVAFAVVSGHFMGAQGRRVGMGLDPDLAQKVESYRTLLDDAFDDRAFNFRLEQGDLLIWIGMKPFIDGRVRLYGGADSLVPLHQGLRLSMRESPGDVGLGDDPSAGIPDDPQLADGGLQEPWPEVFDRYEINQVLPRLSGATPDYVTYYALLKSDDWQLTGQGAATAVFCRTNSDNEELAAYLQQDDATQFVSRFLQTDAEEPEASMGRRISPQPPSFYDKYVYLPYETTPNNVTLAEHYNFLRQIVLQDQNLRDAIALSYEAIRNARRGLRDDPNHVTAYRVLAITYQFLEAVETSLQQSQGQAHPLSGRFLQIVSSYQQALDCVPGDIGTEYQLFEVYNANSRFDLALKYLELVEAATGSTSILPPTNPQQYEQVQQNDARKIELEEGIANVREQVDQALQADTDRLSVAQMAYTNGCPLMALEILEGDLTVAASNPAARMLMGVLLLEVGRIPEALDQLESLRGTGIEQQSPLWPVMAAYANLAVDDLATARATLKDSQTQLNDTMTAALLESAPMRFVGPAQSPEGDLVWGQAEEMSAVRQIQTVAVMNTAIQARLEQNELLQALIAIEAGNISDATRLLEQLITRNPGSNARPLVEQYLLWIADKKLPPVSQPEINEVPALLGLNQPGDDPSKEDVAETDNKAKTPESPATGVKPEDSETPSSDDPQPSSPPESPDATPTETESETDDQDTIDDGASES